ncbi:MAG: hypothetical protein JXB49_17190 [Bacteroidales bacterium]|nr:hypothetical protein [Bacteroidales bacterium]
MKSFLFAYITFFLSILTLLSQTDEINHEKYNHYRERLFREFIAYDSTTQPNYMGTFIAASKRIETPTYKGLWWGEGTINTSCLIQVLVTEYLMNIQNGKDNTQTLHDLYFAMKTYERLDLYAETYYLDKGPGTASLNGFFIRDDVPGDILERYPYLISIEDQNKWSVYSDYYFACCSWKDKYHKEMSQDQVWHLLLGFALVAKFLDTLYIEENYHFQDQAKEYSRLMITRLQGEKNFKWQLRNPVDKHKIPQNRGGKVRIMAYGFAEAGHTITGENFHKYNSDNGLWRTAFYQGWFVKKNFDDDFCFRILSTIADLPDEDDFNRLITYYYKKKIYKYPQFPLLFILLHSENSDEYYQKTGSLLPDVEALLNEAPMEGPSSKEETWSATNMLIWPESANNGKPGEMYNGLDYMLLHNLYYLTIKE